MERRALASIVMAAALLASSTARADGPAADALRDVGVATKDGALYRGELVEKVPGDHLTIKLASGETRRFAWAELADVATANAPEAKDRPDQAAADAKPPQVRLVVDGEPGVMLERRQNASESWNATVWPGYSYVEQWEVACVAPCTTTVDAASMYRVNGPGVTTSRDFTLPQGRDALRLHLVGRSGLLHGAAIALTVAGGALALAGSAGLIAAPGFSDSGVESSVRGLGIVGIGAGVLMLAIGIPVWLATYSVARTSDGQTLGRAPAAPTRPLFAF